MAAPLWLPPSMRYIVPNRSRRLGASAGRQRKDPMASPNPVSSIALFRCLPEDGLRQLLRASTPLEPPTGTRMFVQGDPADAVYAITGGEGHVRVGADDQRSKTMMFGVFRAGEVFGEVGVLERKTRSADAVTDGRVRLLRIRGAAFIDALGRYPDFALELCRILSERLRWTTILLQDAAFETLEIRLARQLLYLARLDSHRTETGLRLGGRFRQSDLADLLGTTTRSIITILNAWRSAGIVSFDSAAAQLTITRPDGLRTLIEAV